MAAARATAGDEPETGTDGPGPRHERGAPRLVATATHRDRVEAMYREYGPVIYRRCLRLLRDAEEARDVTQEVFIKLMHELKKTGGQALSVRWVFRVTTNHCLNLLRGAGQNAKDSLEPYLDCCAAPAGAAPADALLARAVLSRFDAVTQAVAVGVFVHGMDYEEVSDMLGISQRTICRKVDRFLVNARKFLARADP